MSVAGGTSPRSANASRIETLREQGIPWSIRISFLGPAMSRTRLCGAPKSAESKTAHATRSGWAASSSLNSARVALVATFSKLHEWHEFLPRGGNGGGNSAWKIELMTRGSQENDKAQNALPSTRARTSIRLPADVEIEAGLCKL